MSSKLQRASQQNAQLSSRFNQNPESSTSQSPLRFFKGVGPKRAILFEKLGVHTLKDLLYFFPSRHEDRSNLKTIESIIPGESVVIRGEILSCHLRRVRSMLIFEARIGDATGTIQAIWFNQAYLRNILVSGRHVVVFGKSEIYQNRLQINSPEYELIDDDEELTHSGGIIPIYPLTEGLFQKNVRSVLKEAMGNSYFTQTRDHFSDAFRNKHGLMEISSAIRNMHFPEGSDLLEKAKHRIIFDEFFKFHISMIRRAQSLKSEKDSHALFSDSGMQLKFENALSFKLTNAQKQVISEIRKDLLMTQPMNRLLQGDVGSGKTVVAGFALYVAAQSKKQGAFMVPTEILAEQHFRSLKDIFAANGISMELLTSSTTPDKREKIIAYLKQGKIDVIVGTHALLVDDVKFKNLALVVIDEQHKFGVEQRTKLFDQSPRPHQLIMTATPIPRTLSLSLFGDLSVSVLNELPSGRKPIKTYVIAPKNYTDVYQRMIKRIGDGEQAYFVFPLIDETEKSDLLAAKQMYESLRTTVFKSVKMGLVHGRLKQIERDSIMRDFRAGDIKILVATSVIEVGVDNPNATMMVIQNAERFGLSQLHQLRGRIGRGEKPSECYLFGNPKSEESKKRLAILTRSQDGFYIAEEDLKLRGPGDFLGTRQSGIPLFKYADIVRDQDMFFHVRKVAQSVVESGEIEKSSDWATYLQDIQNHPMNY